MASSGLESYGLMEEMSIAPLVSTAETYFEQLSFGLQDIV